jgi:hypothetical protein
MLRKLRRRISDLLLPPSGEMADAATISSPQKDTGQSWNKPEDGKLMKLGGRQEPNPKKINGSGSFKGQVFAMSSEKQGKRRQLPVRQLSSDACLLQRA